MFTIHVIYKGLLTLSKINQKRTKFNRKLGKRHKQASPRGQNMMREQTHEKMFNLISNKGNTDYHFKPVDMILFPQIIILKTIKKSDKSGYQRGDEPTNFWWKYKYEAAYTSIILGG